MIAFASMTMGRKPARLDSPPHPVQSLSFPSFKQGRKYTVRKLVSLGRGQCLSLSLLFLIGNVQKEKPTVGLESRRKKRLRPSHANSFAKRSLYLSSSILCRHIIDSRLISFLLGETDWFFILLLLLQLAANDWDIDTRK